MANPDVSPVGIPSIGYDVMSEDWVLIHDLLGGTRSMREASTGWLPQEPSESDGNYAIRLGRSILYNGYEDTVAKLKNRPFTYPITIVELPADIKYLENDVDGTGKSLETFTKDVLETIIKYGVAHIFIDHTKIDAVAEGEEVTKADEERLGARVFLSVVSPPDLIGWQTEKIEKVAELKQIRIKETTIVADGDYGDAELDSITVYNKDSWEIHEQQDPDKPELYVLTDLGEMSLGKIPLVTIYATRTGFMTAKPPLMNLAWLNLKHWQSYSDQTNILRFTRFGLMFGKGFPKDVISTGLDVGPTKAILLGTGSEAADLKYVEHNGKAIEAGQKDIEDIEQKMRVLGNQPMMKEMPDTATATRADESRTISQLQSWVKSTEKGLRQALEIACEWRKIEPPETMAVEIYSDFEAVVLGSGDKELLIKMEQNGNITTERLLKEQKRRGVFSPDMEPEEEAKAAQQESNDELKSFLPDDANQNQNQNTNLDDNDDDLDED